MPLGGGNSGASSDKAAAQQVGGGADRFGLAMGAGDLLEIRIFDFDRHGSSAHPGAFAGGPNFLDDWRDFLPRRVEGEDILQKGVFRADRFAGAVGPHRALVDPARDGVKKASRLAEMFLQKIRRAGLQIRAGLDAEAAHFFGGGGTDAMESS